MECALGYFINPLVTVLFAVVLFRERLVWPQWVALGLGGAAVVVLTVDYGKPPVIALVLACSFATYGLVKKVIRLDPMRSVAAEGVVSAPFALAVVIALGVRGDAEFGHGAGHTALMVATGPVTLIPLLLFAFAASRCRCRPWEFCNISLPHCNWRGVYWWGTSRCRPRAGSDSG